MLTVFYALIVAVVLFLVDVISKGIISNYCAVGDYYELIPNFLDFKYVLNSGAAFGTMEGMRLVFIVITTCLVTVMLTALLMGKVKNKFYIWSFALIISGGLGNLMDRFFNDNGCVVDFLCFKFSWFPYVFNFADICIVVGGVGLILYLLIDLIRGISKGKGKKADNDTRFIPENDGDGK